MMGEQLLCAVCCVLPAGVINPRDSLVPPPPAALAGDGDDGDEATAITAAAARTTTAPPPSPTTRLCFVVGERDHYTDARALRKVVVARRVRREAQKDLSPRTLRTMPNESRRRRVVVARNVEPSPLSSSLATRARRERGGGWARGMGRSAPLRLGSTVTRPFAAVRVLTVVLRLTAALRCQRLFVARRCHRDAVVPPAVARRCFPSGARKCTSYPACAIRAARRSDRRRRRRSSRRCSLLPLLSPPRRHGALARRP